jgi:primosomal protein N' (replication factor Y)
VVFIQTRLPDHHAVRAAVEHDYKAFARKELMDREFPPYPPTVRLANVVFSGTNEAETAAAAERGAEYLKALIGSGRVEGVHVIGPAPCPIERIKSRWRWHALLRASQQRELTRVLKYFSTHLIPKGGRLVNPDRDPVSSLNYWGQTRLENAIRV